MSPQSVLSTAQMCLLWEWVVFPLISYEQNHAYNANMMSWAIKERASMQIPKQIHLKRTCD